MNEEFPFAKNESISRYGSFVDGGACFELRGEPPRKWRNIHCSTVDGMDFISEVSNLGDGPTAVRLPSGKESALCGYENKFLYVRDEATGVAFSPGGAPLVTPVTDKVCRYWASQTELSATCGEIAVRQRVFVPQEYPCEVWSVTITNTSKDERAVSLFGYVKPSFAGNMRADVLPEIEGVFVSTYNAAREDRLNCCFLTVLQNFHAATGHRDDFFRSEYSTATPLLYWGANLHNRSGYLFAALAAVQARVLVPGGESAVVHFVFGYAPDVATVLRYRTELSPTRIESMARTAMEFELDLAGKFSIEIHNANLEALINHFSKKQLRAYLVNKNGFRDNLQVTLAYSMADYAGSREILLRALASQHSEGWAPCCFRPLDNARRSDQPTWILMAIPALVKESGDLALLDERVPYQDGGSGSVLEHVVRAMRFLAGDVRAHGLVDLREGDWNDGLTPIEDDAPGRESVMVSEQFCYGLLEVAEMAEHMGDADLAAEARGLQREFARRINDHAWDGQWYQRVLCDDGFVIGTQAASEGRIFMNAQSWAILGRVAPPDRARLCMDKVEELLKLDIGYRICDPPFTRLDERVGHSSTVMPGDIENGGCYNHAAGFKAVADCMLGRAEEAWETFRKIAPDNPLNPVAQSEIEPFAFVNLFFAHKYAYGKAFYPWRTGTAAWFTLLIVEWILGARRHHAGLLIDPCLTRTIPRARVVREFRGATFDIHLDNRAGRCKGAHSIHCDGRRMEGNILPDFREGTHHVAVVI